MDIVVDKVSGLVVYASPHPIILTTEHMFIPTIDTIDMVTNNTWCNLYQNIESYPSDVQYKQYTYIDGVFNIYIEPIN